MLGTIALTSLALLATATPASAAEATDLTVNAPEKISVGATSTPIPWTVTGTTYAMASFLGVVGVSNSSDIVPQDIAFAYVERTTGKLWIEAKDVRPGVYTVGWMAGASDLNSEEDAEFTTTDDDIVVKWAGNAALSVGRSGSTVTITATARRFSTASTWVGQSGTTMTIQRYSSGAWRTIKTMTAGTGGKAVHKVTTSTAYSYRVLQGETSTTWADYSATVKK
jgi:hypothetical protein